MSLWTELALKGMVSVAALLALIGSTTFALLGLLGSGSAVGSDESSWRFAVAILAIFASQVSLTVVGCFRAWKWIDDWSLQIFESRNA